MQRITASVPGFGMLVLYRLSRRERQVLRLLLEGLGNKQIAGRLSISEHTVKGHLESMTDTLRVSGRVQLSVWALTYPEVFASHAAPAGLHPAGCDCARSYCMVMRIAAGTEAADNAA